MICLDLKISDDIFKKITKEYNRNVRINSLHNRQRENNGRCDFYRLTVIPQGVYGRYPKQENQLEGWIVEIDLDIICHLYM